MADMLPIGAEVSFIEIGVADTSKSRSFLEQMFGWKFHPFGQGAEGWFQTPSLKAAIHGDDPNQGFLVFFGVPDLEVAIADVIRLGGSSRGPK
jgi:predicted enzyme related to lactoylglutathione lyase